MQPLTPTVNRGNDSYNTNGPSISMVTVIRNHLHTCALPHPLPRLLFESGVYFKSFGLCGYYSRAATIREQRLFEEIWYKQFASLAAVSKLNGL